MLFGFTGGCENSDRLENTESSKASAKAEVFLTPMQSEGMQYIATYGKRVQETAVALMRVKKAMDPYLFDPDSAQYRDLHPGRGGASCGMYNAKNRYGAYVGFKDFVMTGDGRIVTSNTSGGIEASSDIDYIQSYLDACGTKAQIAAYRSTTESPAKSEPTLEAPSDQEPDRILDAPPSRDPPDPDIPTA